MRNLQGRRKLHKTLGSKLQRYKPTPLLPVEGNRFEVPQLRFEFDLSIVIVLIRDIW